MKHTHRLRVNFLENATDLQVLVLARLGQHTKAIAQRTGLSVSQVQYRVVNGNCKGVRREFRDGQTREFSWCYDAVRERIGKAQIHEIRQNIAKGLATVGRVRS